MAWFKRKPRISVTGTVDRIGIDVGQRIEGRDTVWFLKLEGSPEIHRLRDRRAPDGHLALTKPGDTVTVHRRGRRILSFVNEDVAVYVGA